MRPVHALVAWFTFNQYQKKTLYVKFYIKYCVTLCCGLVELLFVENFARFLLFLASLKFQKS